VLTRERPGRACLVIGLGARSLAVFGRVPFAYYLLHIPLVHPIALAISLVRTPAATGWLFHDHPLRRGPVPDGYMWSLGLRSAPTPG
jgi:hypothetical protein